MMIHDFYSRRYMPWSRDSWNLDCCYLPALSQDEGLTSYGNPKELFLLLQEVLQEVLQGNESDYVQQ